MNDTNGDKSGLDTNQSNPTQNSQSTGTASAGPGSGPKNQTYNQPPANDTYTPGTRYSEPFADRQRNFEPDAPITDVVGQPASDADLPLEATEGEGFRDGGTSFDPNSERSSNL